MRAHIALAAGLTVAVLPASPAAAQIIFGGDGWSGEAGVSASNASGNTEALDLGINLSALHEGDLWRNAGNLVFDYGETDGEESKNKVVADYQLDRELSPRSYGFGRTSYEVDEFSGYDYRAFLGLGLGWKVIDVDETRWELQGGPGLQIDAVRDELDDLGAVVTPGETTQTFALGLGSRYGMKLNEAVSLTNDSDVTWSEETTIVFNSFGLNAQLMDQLAARFSFDVTHDTEPPADTENTDTVTRASLIYTFGE